MAENKKKILEEFRDVEEDIEFHEEEIKDYEKLENGYNDFRSRAIHLISQFKKLKNKALQEKYTLELEKIENELECLSNMKKGAAKDLKVALNKMVRLRGRYG